MAERAGAHDADGSFPAEDFAQLRAAGLLGFMVPERLGGMGKSFADYAELAYELGRGNGATALILNMHASITGVLALTPDEVAEELGAPEEYFDRRDEILRAAAKGSLYAVAMSERGTGARLSAMSTSYTAEPGGFHVKGSKSFCSGSAAADGFLVAARRAGEREAVVSQFLVPRGEGVTVRETWDSMGMRATGSHDVDFDVFVPADALLGGVEGLALLATELAPQWMVASYAAVYVGVARAAVDAAVAHATERNLRNLPNVRSRIGRADAAVAAAYATVLEAARRVDAGDPEAPQWVWRAKLVAGDTAAQVAASMLEAAGASATRRGSPAERLFRDARCGAIQPATSDVCADWLGVAALGGDPYRDGTGPRW
ncbi:acyl-CoA dehydrogenase family protein [Phytomonospora endophytica]|nr:acyl-CoA dehydrogenase family protein [Phytomonospora endophytica]